MKKTILLGAMLILTMCVINTAAQDTMDSNDKMTMKGKASADSKFMMMLATGGMNEIGLSQTALSKSSNDEIKEYAQKMIDDHTTAGEELKTLAAEKNVTLPMQMDAKHMALNQKLSAMTGSSFDMEYMKAMVKDHEKTVAMLQKEIKSGKDEDAKAFASKLLPTVQGHLEMAKTMMASMSGAKKKMNNDSSMTNNDGN